MRTQPRGSHPLSFAEWLTIIGVLIFFFGT